MFKRASIVPLKRALITALFAFPIFAGANSGCFDPAYHFSMPGPDGSTIADTRGYSVDGKEDKSIKGKYCDVRQRFVDLVYFSEEQ